MPSFIAKDVSRFRVGGDFIAIVLAHIFMIYRGGARLRNRLRVCVRRNASIQESCARPGLVETGGMCSLQQTGRPQIHAHRMQLQGDRRMALQGMRSRYITNTASL
jgi:hypothetical protein